MGNPLFLGETACTIGFAAPMFQCTTYVECYRRLEFHLGVVSKQRYWHILQTIYSTRFGVRVCLWYFGQKIFNPNPRPSKIYHFPLQNAVFRKNHPYATLPRRRDKPTVSTNRTREVIH